MGNIFSRDNSEYCDRSRNDLSDLLSKLLLARTGLTGEGSANSTSRAGRGQAAGGEVYV